MALNTLRSPGVSISERDLSQYTEAATGTAVLVVGFASKGRDYEPMLLTSRSAWLTQYGEPTNEAERYFFNASMEVINQGGILYCCKLPYNNDALDKVTVKTYKFTGDLHDLSSVADYIGGTKYLTHVVAGNYTDFDIEPGSHGSDFLTLAKTAEDFYAMGRLYGTASEGIPYFYMKDEWLGGFDCDLSADGQWTFTPFFYIYDYLSALFDSNSEFRKNLPAVLSNDPYLSNDTFNFRALTGFIEEEMTAETSAKLLIDAYTEACKAAFNGAQLSSAMFRSICKPDNPGVNVNTVSEAYPDFANSRLYAFFRDNSEIFQFLANNVDPQTNKEVLYGQCPYFYCDDSKFNLATYYLAISRIDKILDAREKLENTVIAESYNSLINAAQYAVGMAGEDNEIELELLKGIEAVGIPPSSYALCDDVDEGLDQYKWKTDRTSDEYLCNKLMVPPPAVLTLVDSLRTVLKSELYSELYNKALDGKFFDSPLVDEAVDVYLDRTIVSTEDRRKLNSAKSFNVFYQTTSGKSFFDEYNGPDSSAPELSSVDALIEATLQTLTRDDLLKLVSELKNLSDFQLHIASISDENEDAAAIVAALESTAIDAALRFYEIKKADPSIKTYMEIDSSSDVALMDVETIDGYSTGEIPVSQNSLVIVDKTRGTLGSAFTKDSAGYQKQVVGIIPVITTAANGLYAQALLETGSTGIDDYNCVGTAKTLETNDVFDTNYPKFTIDNKDAALPWHSNDATVYTVSRFVNGTFPSMHFTDDGGLDRQEMKKIGIVVLRAYLDPGEGNKVNYDIVESFVGELDKDAVDPNTGATTFIDTLVNANSEYIEVYSNCFNDAAGKVKLSKLDLFTITNQTAGDLGFYQGMVKKDISLADSIMKPLQLIWEKNESIDEKQLDIVVDAGVSNIAQFIKSVFGEGKGEYDPNSEYGSLFKLRSREDSATWRAIIGMYDNFCKKIRKDCMFVADGPRPFCLQGNKKIVRTSKPKNTIDANILPMLKYITGLNTNYGAGYCDWFQIADEFSGDYFWCPPSIQAMGVYLNTDINFDYWMAPAGLNRGVVPALDVAFSPTQRQADEIYPKSWNYARSYPIEGIVLEGQRTFQSKASSLDRVAARRALLRFERICYQLARWFLYETNDVLTRQRFYDALNGAYAEIKARGGMYDYHIVCDETVNTDEVIERNEFRCKVGIKLNKFMEFLYIEYTILKRSASWEEML